MSFNSDLRFKQSELEDLAALAIASTRCVPGLCTCSTPGRLDRGRDVESQKSTSAREVHVARHQQMLSHLRRMISKDTDFR